MTTTDARTPKVSQIRANARVELCWWFGGSKEQFRIKGRAMLVGPIEAGGGAGGEEAKTSLAFADVVDWEAKRREVFDSLTSHMKASWCRPVPGTPLTEDPRSWPRDVVRFAEVKSEDSEDWRNLERALGNFALLVVDPDEVDYVDLGVVPNRRFRFVLGEKGWEDTEVVA